MILTAISPETAKRYRAAPPQHGVEITTVDGVYIKQIILPKKGLVVPQHSHVWDHATMVACGSLYVWRGDVFDKQYSAPCAIEIPRGVAHTFEAAQDNTVLYCIHNLHDKTKVEILEEHNLVGED